MIVLAQTILVFLMGQLGSEGRGDAPEACVVSIDVPGLLMDEGAISASTGCWGWTDAC